MVSRRAARDAEPVSPDYDDETDDPREGQTSLFLTRLLLDVQKTQSQLQSSLASLKETAERQEKKLETLDQIRGDLREYAGKLDRACSDLKETTAKLDTVRTWVIGASAAVAVFVFLSQFALRFWPSPPALPTPITVTLSPNVGPSGTGQFPSLSPSQPPVPKR